MKVRVWVEQEVEAEISIHEVMDELLSIPLPESRAHLVQILNRCVASLRHCPDELLAQLEPKLRKIVADALRQQALRYDPELALVRGEMVA